MNLIHEFWKQFKAENKLAPKTSYYEAFAFGSNPKMADDLLDLVEKGKKRATTSCLLAYQNEALPRVGDYSIVLDGKENPRLIIQTTSVRQMRFCDMDFDTCVKEEEDTSLDSWIHHHTSFFIEEGKQSGYVFSLDMPILFEEFIVVYHPQNPNMKGNNNAENYS